MDLDKSLSFKTDKFDYLSDLPADYNAGNRFYGRDVAAYLSEQLDAKGFKSDYLDEDWGWLVQGTADERTSFQIAVYNVNEHGEGGRPGAPEWGLWMRAFEHRKLLGLVPKKVEVPVPERVHKAILDSIQGLGSTPSAWADGPGEK